MFQVILGNLIIYNGTVSAEQESTLSTFILPIAIAAGATVLILLILVCVQSCVYYKYYYHGQTTTKVMVRDVYRARQANSHGKWTKTLHNTLASSRRMLGKNVALADAELEHFGCSRSYKIFL